MTVAFSLLLTGTLHSLTASVHFVVFVVHLHPIGALALLQWVDLLEWVVLGHCILRWNSLRLALGEYAFQRLDLLLCHGGGVSVLAWGTFDTFWELDVELDVKVAEVVVTV
jgi:hypothetical protein